MAAAPPWGGSRRGSRSYLHVAGTLAQQTGLELEAPNGDWNALRLGGWRVGAGGVSLGRAVHVDGDATIAGASSCSTCPRSTGSRRRRRGGGRLAVSDALRLNYDWVVSVAASLSAGAVELSDGSVLAAANLTGGANVSVGMGAVAVGSMDAGVVTVAPGAA